MSKYTSILLCIRESGAEVYVEGLPIGVVRGSAFERHIHKMPDGNTVPCSIDLDAVEQAIEKLQVVFDSVA
jgi:hypothetical protein